MHRLLGPSSAEDMHATKDERKDMALLEFGTSCKFCNAHHEILEGIDEEEEHAKLLQQKGPIATPPALTFEAFLPKGGATENGNSQHHQDSKQGEVGCRLLRHYYPNKRGQQNR